MRNDHIVQTIIMRDKLPFPRHLAEVPAIAGGRHERMDGRCYPSSRHGSVARAASAVPPAVAISRRVMIAAIRSRLFRLREIDLVVVGCYSGIELSRYRAASRGPGCPSLPIHFLKMDSMSGLL